MNSVRGLTKNQRNVSQVSQVIIFRGPIVLTWRVTSILVAACATKLQIFQETSESVLLVCFLDSKRYLIFSFNFL